MYAGDHPSALDVVDAAVSVDGAVSPEVVGLVGVVACDGATCGNEDIAGGGAPIESSYVGRFT